MAQTKQQVIKPVFTKRYGTTSVGVFEREQETKNGSFKSYSVALQTSYKKDDKWVYKRISIVKNDLTDACAVLEAARVFFEDLPLKKKSA